MSKNSFGFDVNSNYLKAYVPEVPKSTPSSGANLAQELQILKNKVEKLEKLEKIVTDFLGKDERFKREYMDMIYNLDDDNFASHIIKEKEGMKTEIRQTAESIELIAQDVSGLSAELEVTAGRITQEVTDRTNADAELQSSITQTAEAITSEVTARQSADSALSSAITQTATSITSQIKRTFSGSIQQYYNATYPYYPGSEVDKTKMYQNTYFTGTNKRYYFWNDVLNNWDYVLTPSISSFFVQTASGFKLDGTVRISGDLITEGTISGSTVDIGDELNIIDSYVGHSGVGCTLSIFNGTTPAFIIEAKGGRELRIRNGTAVLELKNNKVYVNDVEWSPYAKFA